MKYQVTKYTDMYGYVHYDVCKDNGRNDVENFVTFDNEGNEVREYKEYGIYRGTWEECNDMANNYNKHGE